MPWNNQLQFQPRDLQMGVGGHAQVSLDKHILFIVQVAQDGSVRIRVEDTFSWRPATSP